MRRAGVKKGLFLLVVLLMVSFVSGCSGGGQESKAQEQASDVIKIGGNYELSGQVATYGNSAKNGIELYFDELNAKGGVLGKKIEFICLDNKSEATEAANVASRLINQEKVVAILGSITSGNTMGFAQIAEDNKIPAITSGGTNPDITVDPNTKKVREYIFRSVFIDPFQGTVMATFATKTLKAKTAAVFVENNSPYSKGLAEYFIKSFEEQGGKIVGNEAFLSEDQDFNATLTKIKSAKPDVVFVPAYYEQVGKIVKQGRDLGITVPFMGGDGWDSPKLAEIAGAKALNNGYFSNHYSPKQQDPIVQDFVAKYEEKYKQTPDALAALGYDAAILLVKAIETAGSAEPEKIKDALAGLKDVQAVTGKFTFDENHNPVKGAVILEMKDGEQVFKEQIIP
ncbi:ABC transporter substrate-binding protein [Desulforamulus ruminis]|uniref:Extracellular ligand-binding receptor n=1 Tax=Desulforamulus ruminis (strain ATCC 23193 / DSM 2154 / NCIMB 8452 / DL) TaxID=696281 RepID=F6DKQ1_DESRL|nr:ABC transporter substrate-binding protein [Desulforamulus ruminis]AEG60426.1 Extracellular ligand-binding receptor [Desulforamulus ruminis DSM 2154]